MKLRIIESLAHYNQPCPDATGDHHYRRSGNCSNGHLQQHESDVVGLVSAIPGHWATLLVDNVWNEDQENGGHAGRVEQVRATILFIFYDQIFSGAKVYPKEFRFTLGQMIKYITDNFIVLFYGVRVAILQMFMFVAWEHQLKCFFFVKCCF